MDAMRSIIILDCISRVDMVFVVHHTGKNMKIIVVELIQKADSQTVVWFTSPTKIYERN
jgi:hypothetical protein